MSAPGRDVAIGNVRMGFMSAVYANDCARAERCAKKIVALGGTLFAGERRDLQHLGAAEPSTGSETR